jgi:hypothetical protein
MTAFSLPQDVLLLLLRKDGKGIDKLPRNHLLAGFVAAALMELASQNRIDSDLARVWVVDPSPIGDAGIDALLGELSRGDSNLEAAELMDRLSGYGDVIYGAALARLKAAGIIRDTTGFFKDLFGMREYRVLDPKPAAELRERLLQVLTTDELPSPRDACLLSLINAVGIADHIFDSKTRAALQARLDAVSKMDLVGQGLGKCLKLIFERFALAYLSGSSL